MSIAASNTGFEIRPARREDLGAIHAMIRELAEYEKLLHLCVGTEPELDLALFGPRPAAEVLIATKAGKPAAFALFFHNFSTFVGRRGLWLEDLYVRPEFRRQGCAHAMLRRSRALRKRARLRSFRMGGPRLEHARDRLSTRRWAPSCCPTGAFAGSSATRSWRLRRRSARPRFSD